MTGVPTPPSPPVPIAPGAWKHTEHPTPSALTRRSQASRAHREGQRGTGRELTPRHHQRVVRSLSRSRSSRGDRRPRHPAGGRGEFKGTAKVGARVWQLVSRLLGASCLFLPFLHSLALILCGGDPQAGEVFTRQPFTTLVSSLRSKRRNCLVVVREKVGDAPQEGAAGAQLPSMDPLQLPFRPRW